MIVRRLFACCVALASLLFACQIVAGIDHVEKTERPEIEAAPPPPPPPPPVPDPCQHIRPPAEPPTEDEGPELPDFILAAHTLSLVPNDGGALPGFDLDGVCTCDQREGAAEGGASSCKRLGNACDPDGGLDNVGAQLIANLAFVPNVNEGANVTRRIDTGRQTILLVISKYNGKANDKEVKLGIVPSDGIRETDPAKRCPGSVEDPQFGHFFPTWCGRDPWSIVPGSVVIAAGAPLGFTPTATGTGYVADYKLVVRLETGTTSIPFGGAALAMGSPEGVMTLVPLGEDLQPRDPARPPTDAEKRLWRIKEGTLTGRLPARDLLAAAGSIPTPGMTEEHLCTSPIFTVLKSTVCDGRDIAKARNFDFVPNRACDALSMAVGFTADPAIWSQQLYREDEPGNECTAGNDDRPVDAGVDVIYQCDQVQ